MQTNTLNAGNITNQPQKSISSSSSCKSHAQMRGEEIITLQENEKIIIDNITKLQQGIDRNLQRNGNAQLLAQYKTQMKALESKLDDNRQRKRQLEGEATLSGAGRRDGKRTNVGGMDKNKKNLF